MRRIIASRRAGDINFQPDDTGDPSKETALWLAAAHGHVRVVRYLGKERRDGRIGVTLCDRIGRSPLFIAAENGHADVVRCLYNECKADPDAMKEDGETPVVAAARNNHVEVVRVLGSECGADIEKPNNKGVNATWIAQQQELDEVLDVLVHECGAVKKLENEDLRQACEKGDMETVRLYAGKVGKIDWFPQYKTRTREWRTCGCPRPQRIDLDDTGRTAVWLAARAGQTEVVRFLCKEVGADPNIQDAHARSPVFIATEHNRSDTIRCLVLECGANVDTPNKTGRSPIHWAAELGWTECVLALGRDCGAKVDAPCLQGWAPIHVAARDGHADVVLALAKECGSNVDLPTLSSAIAVPAVPSGWTARDIASHRKHDHVSEILKRFGAIKTTKAYDWMVDIRTNMSTQKVLSPLHTTQWTSATK